MEPHPLDQNGPSPWAKVDSSGKRTVESLNRFLSAMVRDTWDDLDRALRITENFPDFSGILPLGDPALRPYLNKPGIFFIFGPHPALSLLHVGASRGPTGFVLRSRIEKRPDGGYGWRWETRSDDPPTFAAVATMEEYWAFAPPLRNLLERRLAGDAARAEDPGGGHGPV